MPRPDIARREGLAPLSDAVLEGQGIDIIESH